MSTNHPVLPQYINPQHTDKLYNEHQFVQCYTTPRDSTGLTSAYLTTPRSNTRGLALEMADDSTYISENSPDSSIGSSSGYMTPSTLSTASSRRHSLIIPENQQCFLMPASQSQTSPTPLVRRTARTRNPGEQNHGPLTASFSPYSESLGSTPGSLGNRSFHSGMPSDEILLDVNIYHNKANGMEWQCANTAGDHSSAFDQGLQMSVPCLSMDLAAGFNATMASQEDLARQPSGLSSATSFHSPSRRQSSTMPAQASYVQLHTLAEPFEPMAHISDRSTRSPSPLPTRNSRYRRRSGFSSTRRHKPSKKTEPAWREPFSCHLNNNSHKCAHCDNSFKRPEHLKRHERKHLPPDQTNMLPCFFAECDRKIKDRPDNMRAHLQVTHFKYGKSERGGKNRRFSMKDSMKMNLRSEDARWTQLLEGGIRFGDTETGYWKMLGYSIKETQEVKVKDLIPEWEGPAETNLKKFDPRWKKLLEGNMTFEQAMETGRWMPEGEKEGLLGVDMMTSRDMGLQDLDPRWKKLLEGSMSIETSEKLGVKHLNPSIVGQPRVQMKSRL